MSQFSAEISARAAANAPLPDVGSWEDLAGLKTRETVLPRVVIWIDGETGERRVTRLLESTAETDISAGVQRPKDFDASSNPKVWFLAS